VLATPPFALYLKTRAEWHGLILWTVDQLDVPLASAPASFVPHRDAVARTESAADAISVVHSRDRPLARQSKAWCMDVHSAPWTVWPARVAGALLLVW
jgi:hypothetical protein